MQKSSIFIFHNVMTACGSVPKNGAESSSSLQIQSAGSTDSGAGEESPYGDNNKDKNKNSDSEDSENNVDVSSQLIVHFIDIGHTGSILIQQGNENMLIDAGNNDDEETLKNYLNNLGIIEFKYVVGTHPH